jgi:curved DNA-binding protein CbpA
MVFKDYYKILEVTSSAAPDEIKKSYRRLALKYHPDKTNGDKTAESKFREIKEAYDVLSKAVRREGYDYDWNRFYKRQSSSATNRKSDTKKNDSFTPGSVLIAVQKLKHWAATTPGIPPAELYNNLNRLLNHNIIKSLLIWGDVIVNRKIIYYVLKICNYLPFAYIESITVRIAKIAGPDNEIIEKIYAYSKKRKREHNLAKLKGAIAILILISLFILMMLS